jgi:hypothetical protein
VTEHEQLKIYVNFIVPEYGSIKAFIHQGFKTPQDLLLNKENLIWGWRGFKILTDAGFVFDKIPWQCHTQ